MHMPSHVLAHWFECWPTLRQEKHPLKISSFAHPKKSVNSHPNISSKRISVELKKHPPAHPDGWNVNGAFFWSSGEFCSPTSTPLRLRCPPPGALRPHCAGSTERRTAPRGAMIGATRGRGWDSLAAAPSGVGSVGFRMPHACMPQSTFRTIILYFGAVIIVE